MLLAFFFGYLLTFTGVRRAGLPVAAAVRIALAADTVSIAVMEIVDNGILLVWPSAMEAGLADLLFWGSLAIALAVAFVVTVPVNRAMIARGLGHAKVHAHHALRAHRIPRALRCPWQVCRVSALAGRRGRTAPGFADSP